MLNALRDNTKTGFLKYILLGFLLMAGGGLVLTDVGGFFRGGNFGNHDVAKGGGVTIGVQEFDRTVRRVLGAQGISPQEAYRLGLINQILTSEIQQRLLTRETQNLGVHVSDDDVMTQISKLTASIAAAGGQNKSDAIRQILRQQGISEEEFINSIRQETGNTLLRGALLSGAGIVPPALVSDYYRFEKQTRDVEAIILSSESVTGIDQPTDDQLTKYYDANKLEYAIPETRSLTLAVLNTAMLKKEITITDEQIQKYYDDNIARYTKPERRNVQQAVVSDPAQAEKITSAVKDGASLKDAVISVTGDAKAYLAEDDYQQSGLLPEISAPVFAGKEGDVIGPVQTELGNHVMKITKILPPDTVPLGEVKKEITDTLSHAQSVDAMLNLSTEVDDRLAGGESLEAIVKEYGLTTETLSNVRVNGLTDKGTEVLKSFESDRAKILAQAFEFNQGETTPLIELDDGRFATVRIDQVTPSSYKPFDDVRDTLRKRWIKEQKDLTNRARALDAVKQLESGSASMAEMAKKTGGKLERLSHLTRAQTAPKILGPVAHAKIFTSNKVSPFMAETEDGILVINVTDIALGSTDKASPSDLEAITRAEKSGFANDVLGSFVNDIGQHAEVKINQRLLDMMYGATPDNTGTP